MAQPAARSALGLGALARKIGQGDASTKSKQFLREVSHQPACKMFKFEMSLVTPQAASSVTTRKWADLLRSLLSTGLPMPALDTTKL